MPRMKKPCFWYGFRDAFRQLSMEMRKEGEHGH
jgi:hypothetical protein